MQELRFRSDYARTTDGLTELTKLINEVFGVDVSPLNRLGHDPSVVAFGWWLNDELVANVSLYERRLWLMGERVTAFGVQSVAVKPAWRGRGLFRDLMRRALEYADARVGLVILATATPSLYTSFGFRQVEESTFGGTVARNSAQPKYRRLSLANTEDVALLRDLFARRAPTSFIASACDHPALFLLKAIETPDIELIHLPDLDSVVAIRGLNQRSLNLLDVVAPSIPSLTDIVSALGYGGQRIRVDLSPDRLSWTPEVITPIDNGHMVRGPFPPEGQAFMLSDMTI